MKVQGLIDKSLPFKFQYDNTLSPNFIINFKTLPRFKFQYDNTLRQTYKAIFLK